MDPIPMPQPNNQKENERVNISVPPEGAFKSDVQPPKNIDTRLKNQAPFQPNNPVSETKIPDIAIKAPSPFPEALPFAPDEPSGKSFEMMMAGTIIFLTILLIAGVFIFKKGAIVPAPTNSPIVSASATPAPTADPNLDTDKDGIPDVVEAAIGTNPNDTDTDRDTFLDLNEIKNGYSPLIAGAAGKYTPEEWQTVKDEIRTADEKFYESVFGTLLISPSPNTSPSPSPS